MDDVTKYERMLAKAKAAGDNAAVAYFNKKLSGLRSGEVQASAEGGGPSTASGLGAQVVAGINRGAVGALAIPDMLGDLTTSGLAKLGVIDPATAERVNARTPGYEEMIKGWEGFAGELPKPRNAAEQTVSDISEFIPGLGAGAGIKGGLRALAGGVGAGTGAEIAEYITDGSAAEPYAKVLGAVLGGRMATPKTIGQKEIAKAIGDPDAMRRQVSRAADKKWTNVRAQGAEYDPRVIKKMVRDIKTQRPEFTYKDYAPTTAGIIKRLEVTKPTAEALETPKRMLGRAASQRNPIEGVTPDLSATRELNRTFKETLDKAPVTTKTGMSSDQFKNLQYTARELSQRKILDKIIKDLDLGSEGYLGGAESALRNRAGSYIRNNAQNMPPEVLKALEEVVGREGILGNLIYMAGNRVGGSILGALGLGGGATAALAGAGVHTAARKLGELKTTKAAKKARQIALAGRKAQGKIKQIDEAWKRKRNMQTLIDALYAGTTD
jgi:hypothetical protein